MKKYIGTKVIKAKPMTRLEYNQLRGWTLPSDENGDDEGFLVEDTAGGKPNLAGYAGYISWSPKEHFEAAYSETTGLSFGMAIEALKKGVCVARAGWNGKGMWLSLIQAGKYEIYDSYAKPQFVEGSAGANLLPFIGMKTADDKFVPWLASQTDVLADDWVIVS